VAAIAPVSLLYRGSPRRPSFDGGPRDPRWVSQSMHQREAAWDNSRPLWGDFIPEFGSVSRPHASVGQADEFVKRPVTVASWRQRDNLRKVPPQFINPSKTNSLAVGFLADLRGNSL
jgi:hypothetical protein